MKKLLFILIASLFIISGCNKTKKFTVTMDLFDADGQTVYLCKSVGLEQVCIDSTVFQGKNAVLKADFDDPQILYFIKFDLDDQCGYVPFFTENQNTTISGVRDDMPHWTIYGCQTMNDLTDFHKKSLELYEDSIMEYYAVVADAYMIGDTVKAAEFAEKIEPLVSGYYEYQIDFIKSNAGRYLGHYMLDEFKHDFDIETVKRIEAGFTNESVYRDNVKKFIEEYEEEDDMMDNL